jgi:hypothetical protein
VQAAFLEEDRDADPSIVGFWHFKFILGPNTIDAGTQQWHSDGTEVINSGARSPITGSVCLGVWKKVGERHYKLNHRGIGWNAEGTALQEVDASEEDVVLSHDGNSYSGTSASLPTIQPATCLARRSSARSPPFASG